MDTGGTGKLRWGLYPMANHHDYVFIQFTVPEVSWGLRTVLPLLPKGQWRVLTNYYRNMRDKRPLGNRGKEEFLFLLRDL